MRTDESLIPARINEKYSRYPHQQFRFPSRFQQLLSPFLQHLQEGFLTSLLLRRWCELPYVAPFGRMPSYLWRFCPFLGNASRTILDNAWRNCSILCPNHPTKKQPIQKLTIRIGWNKALSNAHTWTIIVSILSGLNLSLYRDKLWARPRAIAIISCLGSPPIRLSAWLRIHLISSWMFELDRHVICNFSVQQVNFYFLWLS